MKEEVRKNEMKMNCEEWKRAEEERKQVKKESEKEKQEEKEFVKEQRERKTEN